MEGELPPASRSFRHHFQPTLRCAASHANGGEESLFYMERPSRLSSAFAFSSCHHLNNFLLERGPIQIKVN